MRQPAQNHNIMTWATALGKNELKNTTHTHTYRYKHIYTTIHTHTYVYIHTYTPFKPGQVGICRGGSSNSRPVARRRLPRSAQMELEAGSPYANSVGGDHWWHQGLALAPPNACCAHGCAKTGPGVGHRWQNKVVWLLPRGALSGARGVLPQQGVFGGRCDGVSASDLVWLRP